LNDGKIPYFHNCIILSMKMGGGVYKAASVVK